MKRVAIYTRVSTGSDEQASSLKSQQEYYENWCKQNEYDLFHVYAEKGLTGTNARRPEFIQMMWEAGLDYQKNDNGHDSFEKTDRKPKFDLIVCKDVTRFSRHQIIGLQTIEYLRDKKVYVYFENTGLNSADDDWYLRASIMFTMAQNESHNTSRRIKFGKRHNAQKGKYRIATKPYGFDKNEDGELIINEKEAEVIRYIFNKFETEGSHKIAFKLNEKGIPTKHGNEWGHYHIVRIIKNEIYAGTAISGKYTKDNVTDTKRRVTEEHEQIRVENAVEPIVSYDIWHKANKIRESRINHESKRGKNVAIKNPFYERVFCGDCGSKMIMHTKILKDKTHKYSYMCHNRVKRKKCKMRSVAQDVIFDFIDRITLSNLSDAMGNYHNLKVLNQRIEQESNLLNERVKALNEQIRELKKNTDTLVDSLTTSLVNSPQSVIDALTKRIDDNDKQIKQLQSQIDKTNISSLHDLAQKVKKKTELINQLKGKEYIKLDRKIELINDIVVDHYEIEFNFKLPNYRDEIEEFNELYPNDIIDLKMGMKSFIKTFRREHKAAREYWEQIEYDYLIGKEIENDL